MLLPSPMAGYIIALLRLLPFPFFFFFLSFSKLVSINCSYPLQLLFVQVS